MRLAFDRFAWGLAALLLCARMAQAAVSPPPAIDRCHVPPALLADSAPLRATAAALKHHHPLIIVTLGSSSTAGYGATAAAKTYPAVLQRVLTQALGKRVRVVNRGVNGEVVGRTAARIPRVLADHPTLVIWQTGTNDLLRAPEASAQFRQILAGGVGRLRRAGADVILMDLQYFPKGERRPALGTYLDVIGQVAQRYDVPVIHRHKIMSYWVASGEMSVSDMLYRDHFHMSDRGYDCLGRVVGDFILHKADPASSTLSISKALAR